MSKEKSSKILPEFDIKVETYAAALLQEGNGYTEQIIIAPQGAARRRSHHELRHVRKKHYDSTDEIVLLLEVYRKGLFDTLPEGLFIKDRTDIRDKIEKARNTEKQLENARKFFLPYEQALYLPRIDAERQELAWMEDFPDFLEKFWGLDTFRDCLNEEQRRVLYHILPLAYRITGDWEMTKACFEAVLTYPVSIQLVDSMEYEIPDAIEKTLEDFILGDDTLLGSVFRNDMPTLEVTIKEIPFDEIEDFLVGGAQRRILEEILYAYFIPIEVPIATVILGDKQAWQSNMGEMILGYNLRI